MRRPFVEFRENNSTTIFAARRGRAPALLWGTGMKLDWLSYRIWAEVFLRWAAAWLGKIARSGPIQRWSFWK